MLAPTQARRYSAIFAFLLAAGLMTAASKTTIVPPPNMFTPAQDAELGREAAEVLRTKLPLLQDTHVDRFVNALTLRLVEAIPEQLRQSAFQYQSGILDVSDAVSIAFPGWPVFISRRMLELAENDDAVAGLVAHQLAHIVLRHATAQASQRERYQIGAITGRHIGLAAAAPQPGILERAADFSVDAYYLRYEPTYEQQAVPLGQYC
jgi:predicted Zn-dependent protease